MKEILNKIKELPVYEFGVSLMNAERFVKVSDLEKAINEAEAKWEEDCCVWTFMEGVEDCRCGCNSNHVDYMIVTKYNYCPYCGKHIKISEVE